MSVQASTFFSFSPFSSLNVASNEALPARAAEGVLRLVAVEDLPSDIRVSGCAPASGRGLCVCIGERGTALLRPGDRSLDPSPGDPLKFCAEMPGGGVLAVLLQGPNCHQVLDVGPVVRS